jgi:hypothetical protein
MPKTGTFHPLTAELKFQHCYVRVNVGGVHMISQSVCIEEHRSVLGKPGREKRREKEDDEADCV